MLINNAMSDRKMGSNKIDHTSLKYVVKKRNESFYSQSQITEESYFLSDSSTLKGVNLRSNQFYNHGSDQTQTSNTSLSSQATYSPKSPCSTFSSTPRTYLRKKGTLCSKYIQSRKEIIDSTLTSARESHSHVECGVYSSDESYLSDENSLNYKLRVEPSNKNSRLYNLQSNSHGGHITKFENLFSSNLRKSIEKAQKGNKNLIKKLALLEQATVKQSNEECQSPSKLNFRKDYKSFSEEEIYKSNPNVIRSSHQSKNSSSSQSSIANVSTISWVNSNETHLIQTGRLTENASRETDKTHVLSRNFSDSDKYKKEKECWLWDKFSREASVSNDNVEPEKIGNCRFKNAFCSGHTGLKISSKVKESNRERGEKRAQSLKLQIGESIQGVGSTKNENSTLLEEPCYPTQSKSNERSCDYYNSYISSSNKAQTTPKNKKLHAYSYSEFRNKKQVPGFVEKKELSANSQEGSGSKVTSSVTDKCTQISIGEIQAHSVNYTSPETVNEEDLLKDVNSDFEGKLTIPFTDAVSNPVDSKSSNQIVRESVSKIKKSIIGQRVISSDKSAMSTCKTLEYEETSGSNSVGKPISGSMKHFFECPNTIGKIRSPINSTYIENGTQGVGLNLESLKIAQDEKGDGKIKACVGFGERFDKSNSSELSTCKGMQLIKLKDKLHQVKTNSRSLKNDNLGVVTKEKLSAEVLSNRSNRTENLTYKGKLPTHQKHYALLSKKAMGWWKSNSTTSKYSSSSSTVPKIKFSIIETPLKERGRLVATNQSELEKIIDMLSEEGSEFPFLITRSGLIKHDPVGRGAKYREIWQNDRYLITFQVALINLKRILFSSFKE